MRLLKVSMIVSAALLLFGQADTTLQKAIRKETMEGDLKGAIELYRKAIGQAAKDRGTAAQALVRMGACYEKLGDAEARKAYERVVHDFADQKEMAVQAQTRLASLGGGHGGPATVTMRWVSDGREPDNEGRPSPDGQWLSYTSPDGDLGIYNLLTGERRLLKRNSPNAAGKRGWVEESIWSPDGKQIAYGWDYCGADCVELRVMQADGSGDRTLYRNDKLYYVYPFDWSPDGKYISAILIRNGLASDLALVDARTGETRSLKAFPPNQQPRQVLFSPDGRYLAYDLEHPDNPCAACPANRDIWLMSLDGSQNPLVQNPADDRMLAWLPDGVLFASDRTGTMDVWRQTVANGKPQGPPERLKAGIGNLQGVLGLTRKGALYYSVSTATNDVFIAQVNPGTGKVSRGVPVSQRHAGHYGSAAWSPDGKTLASLAQLTGNGPFELIAVQDMVTGEEHDLKPALANLGNFKWSNWGSINWTPDGRSLLVVSLSAERQRRGIYKIDARSGEAVQLASPEFRPVNPQLSAAGKTLYYMERSAVVALDLPSGNKHVVIETDRDGYSARNFVLSPDGEHVAFPVDDWARGRMLVASTKGGEARVVRETKTELLQPFGLSWSPDGRYLLYVERPDVKSPYELWRVPVQGGQPEKLGLAAQGLHAPRLHPDGTRIAFSSGSGGHAGLNNGGFEIWVLENFLPAGDASR
jgi:Tol biopolymer transport system component